MIKSIIVAMIAATVCAFILMSAVHWMGAPVGSVPSDSAKMAGDLLLVLMGIISGYVGRGDDK
jgi:hypothetical protein